MSPSGQNAKYPLRANVFRYAVDRKWPAHGQNDEIDPHRKSVASNCIFQMLWTAVSSSGVEDAARRSNLGRKDAHSRDDDCRRCGAARRRDAHSTLKSNASSQRTMRPLDGEGKCAVHMRVEVSQKRPNSSRRDSPDCFGSKSDIWLISG